MFSQQCLIKKQKLVTNALLKSYIFIISENISNQFKKSVNIHNVLYQSDPVYCSCMRRGKLLATYSVRTRLTASPALFDCECGFFVGCGTVLAKAAASSIQA